MNIGKGIKVIRKQLGFTQTQLSEMTGVSQTSLSKIEGGTIPNEETLTKIATALNVPTAVFYLLSLDDSDVPENKRGKFQVLLPVIKSLALQIVDMPE